MGIDRGVGGLELAGLLVKIKGLGGSEKILGGSFGGVGFYCGLWVGFWVIGSLTSVSGGFRLKCVCIKSFGLF